MTVDGPTARLVLAPTFNAAGQLTGATIELLEKVPQ